ncbi:peptidyl-tRNA hydrolase [Buchnera aphidicola (Nipponaphis monzeni)]|uniref:Peptidyl-tRNA hydrolase n=1 Tax=Buchnera aphidicola (Nipponaphis monzeni) TaxID=2495405 RepID=A0A455TA59_9GAMM|nr:aminoacyl-tRNA hydrolase [Buchnera aphidicola]BBI01170.1 peptidyl-tRNA hydrolase [Buchnera aphidicola (Nipponaphis monzeni)]
MKRIKLIVGLGNPLPKYEKNRHNIGSRCVKKLASKNNVILQKKFLGSVGVLNIVTYNVKLFVPNIFMNLSGQSVTLISNFYNIDISNILIVHDDLDLLPGSICLKQSSGHGGHNGIRSIINVFRSKKKFFKMSIGIGRPLYRNDVSSFVLSNPTITEELLINKAICKAISSIMFVLNHF